MGRILIALLALPGLLAGDEAGTAAPAVSAEGGPSLDRLLRAHDRRLFDDLLGFVGAVERGPDGERAHRLLFDLAIRYGWYAEAEGAARAYLDDPERGDATPLGQLVAAMADAEAGRLRASIVLFRELMAGFRSDDQVRLAADLADTLADIALASADVASAREIYTCFLDRFGAVPGVTEKVEGEFARIALLGGPAPRVEGRDLAGEPVAVGPEAGGYRLVVFWATASEPCLAEWEALSAAAEAYCGRGLGLLGVALDGTAAEVAGLAERLRLPGRQVHQGTSGTDWAGPFRVTSVPHAVLIGPDGTIERMGLRGGTIGSTLAEVLGGPAAQ